MKDQEEDINKFKTQLCFINPTLYQEIFKDTESLSKELLKKLEMVEQARKTIKHETSTN